MSSRRSVYLRRSQRPLYLRRRRARRVRAVLAIAVLVLALGGVAMAVGDHHRSAPKAATAPSHRPAWISSPSTLRPHGSSLGATDAQSIRHVLGYTPFIAAGSRGKRVIALTFDDGPSPYTPAIVRTLVRLRVPATFFIVGQQLQYFSNGLTDELRHGFVIGDHTQNHAWLIQLGAAGQAAQIQNDANALAHHGAPPPRLFRPPYGAYNHQTLAVLRRKHMLMVMWSVDTGDWRRPGTPAIIATVMAHARPGGIVLLHDGGGDRSQTLAALPTIVGKLRREHYGFVTVPQLLALDPPPRHQHLPALTGG